MFKNKYKEQIELQIRDMQLYLENNYKDLAIQGRKEAIQTVEAFYSEGKIKAKDYNKYKKVLDQYTEEMKNYNHQQFYRT